MTVSNWRSCLPPLAPQFVATPMFAFFILDSAVALLQLAGLLLDRSRLDEKKKLAMSQFRVSMLVTSLTPYANQIGHFIFYTTTYKQTCVVFSKT